MRYKVCIHCDSDFVPASPGQKYCSVRCREKGSAIVSKSRQYRKEVRAKNAQSAMKWKKENYIKTRIWALKHRALKDNVPFDLTENDFEVPTNCPVFGFVMDGKTRDTQWSFDRLIPELGYVKGNVRVISMKANRLKNNATVEDLRKIVEYLDNITSENI